MIVLDKTTISLSRDGQRQLSLNFRLDPGDLALLLGPNGSGKTTILDLIAGVCRPDAGKITVEPKNTPIAYAVQDSASGLLPWRSILSNTLLPSEVAGKATEQADQANTLLREFGLGQRLHDFPYQLSEGEKQIVNLVRTICTPAKIMLLDEPFSALNARTKALAREKLLEVAKGRTTIFVTHDASDLDWPFTRYLSIADSSIAELDLNQATKFLNNVASKA